MPRFRITLIPVRVFRYPDTHEDVITTVVECKNIGEAIEKASLSRKAGIEYDIKSECQCEDCWKLFDVRDGRHERNNPEIWLCYDCHDRRMGD